MKQNEILKIALDISVEEGIENLSMRKLASEVGCTPSTIYHHFKDKNDLLNELILYVDKILDEKYFRDDLTIEDMIAMSINADQERIKYQKFMGHYARASFVTEETRAILQNRIERHKALWKKFREDGIVREDLDKKAIYMVMVGMSRAVANDERVDDETRKQISEIIYRGVTGFNFAFENESRRSVHNRIRKSKRSRRECLRHKTANRANVNKRKVKNERSN